MAAPALDHAPTLVTAPDPGDLSPIEAAVMDACNELHEAVAAGDHDRARHLRALLDDLLDRYERTGGEDHPNPDWAIPNQRALAASAAGLLRQAIAWELRAFRAARTPRQREISAGNLADRYIRLRDFDAAVAWFLQARDAAPDSLPVMLTGAQALYLAGFRAQAERIFRHILDQARAHPHMLRTGTELAAYLDYETRLRLMAPDLPSLAALFDARGGAR